MLVSGICAFDDLALTVVLLQTPVAKGLSSLMNSVLRSSPQSALVTLWMSFFNSELGLSYEIRFEFMIDLAVMFADDLCSFNVFAPALLPLVWICTLLFKNYLLVIDK